MENLNNNLAQKKRLYAICAIALGAIYAVYVLGLEPLYESAAANVAVSSTVVDLLYYACEFLEHLAISVCYAVLIFCVYKLGAEHSRGLLWVFVAAACGKYLLKTIVSWYYNGAIPLEWYVDLIDVAYFVILEAVQFIIVRALVKKVIAKGEKRDSDLSFVKLYDKKNPLMRAAASAAVAVFVIRLALRVISDAATMLIDGAPDKSETWILMTIAYLSTAVVGMLCYLAMILTIHIFGSKFGKKD